MSLTRANYLPNWESGDILKLRPFALAKLIVADLDGTLLRSSSVELSETIKSLKRKLRSCKSQVQFTLATGRAAAGVSDLVDRLDIHGVPVIVYNGSLVLDFGTQQVISKTTIPQSAMNQVLRVGREARGCVFAYFFHDPMEWTTTSFDRKEIVVGWTDDRHTHHEFNRMPVEWYSDYEFQESISPVAMIIDLSNSAVEPTQVRSKLLGIEGISVTASIKHLLEIRPTSSNKGAALAQVARKLGIAPNQVLAIGDNDNDCEMLEWAGIGVSVAGASEKAVESSRYMCRHGVVEGVIEILRLVIQSHRYLPVLQSL